jgi:hypothetical protein
MKWIRLFILGIVILAVDATLMIIGEVGVASVPRGLLQALGVVGGISLTVGLIGLILGGRH